MVFKFFAILLVVSLVGIAACNLFVGQYKPFVIAILFGIVNVLIFLVK